MTRVTVFVNGCFDVLHLGHVRLFEYAAALGDRLVVAIDSDSRVAEMKGELRPINNQDARAEVLRALRWVDEVLVFSSEEELCNITATLRPSVMVVGEDWEGKGIVGAAHADSVKYFGRVGDYSTTKTIQRIIDGG